MIELLPCPFCGTAMNNHGHCFSHPRPAKGDCIIRHYSFDRQKAAKKEAEVENFRFHDFRHTRGTRIVRATGSLAAAKAALAHRSINTTLRYAHVLDDDVRHALDASESRTIPGTASGEKKKA
jgi:integrase